MKIALPLRYSRLRRYSYYISVVNDHFVSTAFTITTMTSVLLLSLLLSNNGTM